MAKAAPKITDADQTVIEEAVIEEANETELTEEASAEKPKKKTKPRAPKIEKGVANRTDDTLGARLIDARKKNDFTQQDLAKRLGISRAAVGQWEINAYSPAISMITDVAKILHVAPEWLAFGINGSNPHIVYRSAERDNIMWVADVEFGEDVDELNEMAKWGIPADYLKSDLKADMESCIIATMNSHAVEDSYEFGTKVIVDKSSTKPSPAGIFLFWDGMGFAFAHMQAVPGNKAPTVRVSQNGADAYDMPLSDLEIIGRVRGGIAAK